MNNFNTGDKFKNFEIIEIIGKGGMGEVYLATDERLARQVAIKTIAKPESSESKETEKRFIQEAQSLAAINHPNVVSIYDIGSEQNFNYIVMEHVNGSPLKEIIRTSPIDTPKVLKYFKSICSGIAAVHQKEMLHRDIKPSNIIIDRDDNVKLVDFGIAKRILNSNQQLTLTNQFVGTVSYCSPEVLCGKGQTKASDVFSLGIIFYEMLLGFNPFMSQNQLATIEKIKSDTLIIPDLYLDELPENIEDFFAKMIEKNPDKRFQDANEVLSAFSTIMNEFDGGESTEIISKEPNNYDEEYRNDEAFRDEDSLTHLYDIKERTESNNGGNSSDDLPMVVPVVNNPASGSHQSSAQAEGEVDFGKFATQAEAKDNLENIYSDFNTQQKEESAGNDQNTKSMDEIVIPQKEKVKNYSILAVLLGFLLIGFANDYLEIIELDLAQRFGVISKYKPIKNLVNFTKKVSRSPASIFQTKIEPPKIPQLLIYEIYNTDPKSGKIYGKKKRTFRLKKISSHLLSSQFRDSVNGKTGTMDFSLDPFYPREFFQSNNSKKVKTKLRYLDGNLAHFEKNENLRFEATHLMADKSFVTEIFNCRFFRDKRIPFNDIMTETKVILCDSKKGSSLFLYYSESLNTIAKIEFHDGLLGNEITTFQLKKLY